MRAGRVARDAQKHPTGAHRLKGVDTLSDARRIIVMPNGRGKLVPNLDQRFGFSSEGVLVLDPAGRLVYTNPVFSQMVGFDCDRFVGKPHPFPWYVDDPAAVWEERFQFLESEQARRLGVDVFAWKVRDTRGEDRPVWLSRRKLVGQRGALLGHAVIHIDRAPASRSREVNPSALMARIEELESALRGIALALEQLGVSTGSGPPASLPPLGADLSVLSRREREVLGPLLEGHRVPYIARMLYISPHTVRNHLQSVFRKLGVGSQAELIEKLRAGETYIPEPSTEAGKA